MPTGAIRRPIPDKSVFYYVAGSRMKEEISALFFNKVMHTLRTCFQYIHLVGERTVLYRQGKHAARLVE